MESLFRHTGITINFYDPWPLYSVNNEIVYKCEHYTSYTHEIGAMGGYLSATVEIPMTVADAKIWYEKGIGRRIKVFNHAGVCVWNGFVNDIDIRFGADTAHIGPMTNIGNIIGVMFTPVDFDNGTVGTETETTLVQDIYSQETYGKWEKWLSAGQAEETAAEQVRDVFLADMAYPKSTDDLSIYSGASPVVTLSCVGNLYWLTAYIYNNLSDGLDTLRKQLNKTRTLN